MSNGNTIGGIIMIVLGSIMITLGFLFAVIFFAIGSRAASDKELMGGEIQEKTQNALETTGEIAEIDRDVSTTKNGYKSEIDEVYYDIDDPSNAPDPEVYDMKLYRMVVGIFFVIGVVAACVGVAGVILLIVGIKLVVKGNNQRNNIPASNYQNGPC